MTSDTAERAREWLSRNNSSAYDSQAAFDNDVAKLAALLTQIQAEARERLAAWMIEHSFSTGHGDTFEDLLKELDWQVKELRGRARLEEAKWWHTQVALAYMCDEQEMRSVTRGRIAALAQALEPEEKEGT